MKRERFIAPVRHLCASSEPNTRKVFKKAVVAAAIAVAPIVSAKADTPLRPMEKPWEGMSYRVLGQVHMITSDEDYERAKQGGFIK